MQELLHKLLSLSPHACSLISPPSQEIFVCERRADSQQEQPPLSRSLSLFCVIDLIT